jgi:hypothetical protein
MKHFVSLSFSSFGVNSRQGNSHLTAAWRRTLASLLLLLPVYSVANAQSGRRPPQPQAAPSPTEAPTASELEAKMLAAERGLRKVRILVARQPTAKKLASEDAIFASFVNRLNEFPVLSATAIGDLDRRDVVKKAKSETDTFVVLMKFEIDSLQPGTIVMNSPDLKVTYYVFAPHSGKEKNKDKVYYQAIGGARARRDEWPTGPPLKITPAAAGSAAAVRLHDWLVLVIRAHEKL